MSAPQMTLSGPMFDPAETPAWKSIFGQEGGHYNIRAAAPDAGMRLLRKWFGAPGAGATEFCFVLFSTSGVHGTYQTIEQAEADWIRLQAGSDDPDGCLAEVTFLIVQPRIVQLLYGNAEPETAEDWALLKRLREESWRAVQAIGRPEAAE